MRNALGSVLVLLLTGATAHAGKFEIIGEGTSAKAAEFVRVSITVHSECHSRALDARHAVDDLVSKAVLALDRFKTNIPNQLTISPEANVQKVKTAYINNETVVICDESHSWTSATVLQFKLNNLQLLAEMQDELLGLNPAPIPGNVLNKERIELSLAKPEPGVFADTWDSMSDLALQRAHQNALRQVKVLTSSMTNPRVELVKVAATTNSSGQPLYDRVDSEGDTGGLSMGSVSIKLAREFTFKVDGQ
jgi:hypothetical protein